MRILSSDVRLRFDKLLNSVGLKKSGTHEPKSADEQSDGFREDTAAATPIDQDASTNLSQDNIVANRVFKTVCLFYSVLAVAWCNALTGNTLVHMELFFDVSMAEISLVLPIKAVAGVIGTILCGLIFDHLNQQLVFAISSLFIAIFTVFSPFLGGLVPFIVATCITSLFKAFMTTAGQPYCAELWDGHRYRDPIFHAWFAVGSLGTLMGPLIIAPFLVDLPHKNQTALNADNRSSSFYADQNQVTTGYASTVQLTTWNLTSVNRSVLLLDVNVSGVEEVRYAYITMGLLNLIAFFLFAFAFLLGCYQDKGNYSPLTHLSSRLSQDSIHLTSKKSKKSNVDDQTAQISLRCSESHSEDTPIGGDFKRLDRFLYWTFIAQMFLFYHLYRYGTGIPGSYTIAFAIRYLNFPVQSATLLLSLFHGFQFGARLIGIPVAAFVQPRTMLIFNVLLTAVFIILLLVFVNVWPIIIWIALPMASFSMATTAASLMLWISNRVTISGRLSAITKIGNQTGSLVGPLIVGQLFETSTPMVFVYMLTASSVSHVVLVFVLNVYDARYGNHVARHASAGERNNGDSTVGSQKKSGYKSISEREDKLELTANIETNELQSVSPENLKQESK